jgi:hypothetical protein
LTHEKRAMKRPSRNIPISTVIVAATVVEMFAPMERTASLTKSLVLNASPRGVAALLPREKRARQGRREPAYRG